MTDAANQGNAGMAGAAMRNSAFSGGANALGRLYGNYGRKYSPYDTGQQLSNQYGYENVYGAGGGGQIPTSYDPNEP